MRITDRGVQALFSAFYPLCLFPALLRNFLKARAVPDSLFYRLQEATICL